MAGRAMVHINLTHTESVSQRMTTVATAENLTLPRIPSLTVIDEMSGVEPQREGNWARSNNKSLIRLMCISKSNWGVAYTFITSDMETKEREEREI
ncbi:hypothetical protein NQ315_003489 [Exocentrus adspersus]|uniref:Uncharacterized protein n=1 Tax=Exocentrus adspersus TaxID=1586481 RepID=A0AAV8V8S8_9CUCU|nr:hypothetical protein NQ315_003489 [Exocentrus adspersus]